uniref:Uncharacterized protein n=1 Tax=Monopterus albus TaxID=43700 RepID=A0A3Q3IJ02_MONAL
MSCPPVSCINPSFIDGKCCPVCLSEFDLSTCAKDTCIFLHVCKDNEDGWSPWSEWTYCSATCGRGGQRRGRSCNGIMPFCDGPSVQTRNCVLMKCDRKGKTSLCISDLSQCGAVEVVSCEFYFHFQSATKMDNLYVLVLCLVRTDGNWGHWSPWSACTTTCGEGSITRVRLCNNPPPQKGGRGCTGSARETQPCNNTLCPSEYTAGTNAHANCTVTVAGGWTTWTEWSLCSESCGGGLTSRQRECLNPAPQNGGKRCAGDAVDYESCDKSACSTGTALWLYWAATRSECEQGSPEKERWPFSGPFLNE